MDLSQYRLLTVDEFCQLAGIVRSQFDSERRAGRISPKVLGIRSLRIRFEDYLDWVNKLKPVSNTKANGRAR